MGVGWTVGGGRGVNSSDGICSNNARGIELSGFLMNFLLSCTNGKEPGKACCFVLAYTEQQLVNGRSIIVWLRLGEVWCWSDSGGCGGDTLAQQWQQSRAHGLIVYSLTDSLTSCCCVVNLSGLLCFGLLNSKSARCAQFKLNFHVECSLVVRCVLFVAHFGLCYRRWFTSSSRIALRFA